MNNDTSHEILEIKASHYILGSSTKVRKHIGSEEDRVPAPLYKVCIISSSHIYKYGHRHITLHQTPWVANVCLNTTQQSSDDDYKYL